MTPDSASGSGSGSGSLIGAMPSDFQRCFCWDQAKGQMCGGADFFNSDPCQDWLVNHFWWVPVALVAIVGLLVFPCIFYCARCCCKCCGGRHASYGACCPTEIGRTAFLGYKNSSIAMSKAFFLLCLALGVAFSVCGLGHNSDLSNAVVNAAVTFDGAITGLKSEIETIQGVIQNEQTTGPYYVSFVPQRIANGVQTAYVNFDSRANEAHDRLHDIKHSETTIRDTLSKLAIIEGLVLLGVGLLLALFSFRQAVGMVMVGFCVHMAFSILVLAPHQTLRIASDSVCDNFDSTIVPLATGALQSIGVCNNAEVASGITALASNLQQFVTNPSSQFCQDYITACAAAGGDICYQTPCSDTNQPFPNMNQVTISSTNVQSALDALFQVVSPISNYDTTGHLLNFYYTQSNTLPKVATFASKMTTSAHVTNLLENTLRPALCGDDVVQGRSRAMSGDLTGIVGAGLATIVALIFGMKRFRRMGSYAANTLYAVVEEQQPVIHVTATRVAIIGKMCTADEEALMASPYAASATQGYPATDYGAINTDYRAV
jgi:hypothetical protein